MLRLIGAPVRVIGALAFIVLAYWFGLLAIERLPAAYGALVLLLVPMFGLVVLLLALPVQAAQADDEGAPPTPPLADRVRLRYKSVK
jgi:hypothetical protein